MRYVSLILFLALTVAGLILPGTAEALIPPTTAHPSDGFVTATDSPLLITQYRATYDRLDYIEVYNDSSQLFALDGWSAQYEISYEGNTEVVPLNIELAGKIEPQRYITIAEVGTKLHSPFLYNISATGIGSVQSVSLVPPYNASYLHETVKNPSYTKSNQCDGVLDSTTASSSVFALKRNISSVSGDYLSSLCYLNLAMQSPTVFIDELYMLPPEPTLEIVEVMPRARDCSPFEQRLDCLDYVKVYNSGTTDVQMELYRLRSGSQGDGATASNTFSLSGVIPFGQYRTYQVELSNSGKWLWYEDAYGIERYQSTAVEYPSAGSTREGQVWMYDTDDGTWKWSTRLSGTNNAPLYIAPSVAKAPSGSSLQACRADQFRNPLTNRCKLIATSSATLQACAEGKLRNPETNRCKSVASSASSLSPCRSDQFRNPETNRCKSSVSSAGSLVQCKPGQTRNPATNRCKSTVSLASSLKPCAANQERNPDTNRCRKVLGSSIPSASFAVEDSAAEAGQQTIGWLAFAAVGTFAVGYGVWEWRREIAGGFTGLGKIFKK
jgi:hypothetical protein